MSGRGRPRSKRRGPGGPRRSARRAHVKTLAVNRFQVRSRDDGPDGLSFRTVGSESETSVVMAAEVTAYGRGRGWGWVRIADTGTVTTSKPADGPYHTAEEALTAAAGRMLRSGSAVAADLASTGWPAPIIEFYNDPVPRPDSGLEDSAMLAIALGVSGHFTGGRS